MEEKVHIGFSSEYQSVNGGSDKKFNWEFSGTVSHVGQTTNLIIILRPTSVICMNLRILEVQRTFVRRYLGTRGCYLGYYTMYYGTEVVIRVYPY